MSICVKCKNATRVYKVYLLNRARERARRKQIDFTITLNNIIWPDVCPVLGTKLDYNTRHGARKTILGEHCPSIDRWNNTKGYIPGNAVVISTLANKLKKDATAETLEKVVNYMKMQPKGMFDP